MTPSRRQQDRHSLLKASMSGSLEPGHAMHSACSTSDSKVTTIRKSRSGASCRRLVFASATSMRVFASKPGATELDRPTRRLPLSVSGWQAIKAKAL